MILLDIILFLLIALLCWRGYRDRQQWLTFGSDLLATIYRGKGFWRQLLGLGPIIVGWLLLCHWLANHNARGLAAGGMLLAMALALDAMRSLEERQKLAKEKQDRGVS